MTNFYLDKNHNFIFLSFLLTINIIEQDIQEIPIGLAWQKTFHLVFKLLFSWIENMTIWRLSQAKTIRIHFWHFPVALLYYLTEWIVGHGTKSMNWFEKIKYELAVNRWKINKNAIANFLYQFSSCYAKSCSIQLWKARSYGIETPMEVKSPQLAQKWSSIWQFISFRTFN